MKKKLVNKKVVNSIGVGILAFITATTPVMSVAAQEGDGAGANPTTTDSGDETEETKPSAATTAVDGAHKNNEEIIGEVTKNNDNYKNEAEEKIENAGGEVGSAEDGKVEIEEAVSEETLDNLKNSQEALKQLEGELKQLDDLNAASDKANEELDKALTDKDIEEQLKTLGEKKNEIDELEEATGNSAVDATTKADAVVEAKQDEYENADAAKAAEDEAKATLTELEAAEEDARIQQEEATAALVTAEGALAQLQIEQKAAEEAYGEAVAAVEEANNKLNELLGTFGFAADAIEYDEQTGELIIGEGVTINVQVEKALEKAWAAVKQAEADQAAAEEALEAANEEVKGAESVHAEKVKELDAANAALKELNEAKGQLKAAEQAEESAKEAYDIFLGELAELEKDVTTKEGVKTAAEEELQYSKDALTEAQRTLLAAQIRDNNYSEDAQNERAEDMIKYRMLQDGLVDDISQIEIEDWVDSRGYNNYVVVSYKEKDENGNEVTKYKYYDYIAENNSFIVGEKPAPVEGVYECGNQNVSNLPLTIKEENGEQQYYLGDINLLDPKYGFTVEGDSVMGYAVKKDGVPVKIEMKDAEYLTGGVGTLTIVTIAGEKHCFRNEKEIPIEFNGAGLLRVKIDGEWSIWKPENVGGQKKTEVKNLIFGPKFTEWNDVGNKVPRDEENVISVSDEDKEKIDGKDVSGLKNTQDAAEQRVTKAKGDLATAETNLSTATKVRDDKLALKDGEEKKYTEKQEAANAIRTSIDGMREKWVGEGKADAKDLVDEFLEKYVSEDEGSLGKEVKDLLKKLDIAKAQAEVVGERKFVAGKAQEKASEAYKNVEEAIAELYNLQKQAEVDDQELKALQKKVDQAIIDCALATESKGKVDQNYKDIADAAAAVREAIEAGFKYKEDPTSEDGNNGGGITGGGSTGGGSTTGGGATGGSTTTETPADSNLPTVELEEEDVPLAGGAGTAAVAGVKRGSSAGGAGIGTIETVKADGNGTSGGAGIELEDEEVPLAGPEEEDERGKAGADIVVEDEEIPLAAPIEEQSRMSWWWLILIAILGVTGEEMYRRHKKKLAEEENMNS